MKSRLFSKRSGPHQLSEHLPVMSTSGIIGSVMSTASLTTIVTSWSRRLTLIFPWVCGSWTGFYTQLINKSHQRTGHLFQGRYKSILIQRATNLFEVRRYVVLNPVRARMVERPERWKWSSYRATAWRESPLTCLTTDRIFCQSSRMRAKAEMIELME